MKILKPTTIIPVLVSMVIFIEFLDITIINTAIPSIARDLVVNPLLLKFSIASYFLSLAIFIPISGWCSDKFGTQRMFIFAVGMFIGASLLCGLAQTSWQLTICRFLQGIGGAFMNPVARIILLRMFPPKDLVRIQALVWTPAMLGYVIGPFLGGVIVTYLSWRWIFLLNIPIGLFAIYGALRYIEQYVATEQRRFDYKGFILAGGALCGISFAIEMINHYEVIREQLVIASGVLGVVLFISLAWYCLRARAPLFDFYLFRIRTFRIGFSLYLSNSAINSSISFLLPLMFQENFKLSPLASGVMVLPVACGFLLMRGTIGKFIHCWGFKNTLWVTVTLLSVSIILLAQIQANTSLYYTIPVEFIFGCSLIGANSCTGALNYVDMPKSKTSVATSMDLTFRQFSASLGIGVSALCLTSFAKLFNLAIFSFDSRVIHYTFYFMAVFAAAGLCSVAQLKDGDGAHALKGKN